MVKMSGIKVNGITYFSVKISGRETKGVRQILSYMTSLRNAIIIKKKSRDNLCNAYISLQVSPTADYIFACFHL
jgi:hypothetical protein